MVTRRSVSPTVCKHRCVLARYSDGMDKRGGLTGHGMPLVHSMREAAASTSMHMRYVKLLPWGVPAVHQHAGRTHQLDTKG